MILILVPSELLPELDCNPAAVGIAELNDDGSAGRNGLGNALPVDESAALSDASAIRGYGRSIHKTHAINQYLHRTGEAYSDGGDAVR